MDDEQSAPEQLEPVAVRKPQRRPCRRTADALRTLLDLFWSNPRRSQSHRSHHANRPWIHTHDPFCPAIAFVALSGFASAHFPLDRASELDLELSAIHDETPAHEWTRCVN